MILFILLIKSYTKLVKLKLHKLHALFKEDIFKIVAFHYQREDMFEETTILLTI